MTKDVGNESNESDDGDVRPLLVISASGLATASLGCYGSSWNQTPAIDALAAGGCVFDRWIASRDHDSAFPCCFDRLDQWIEPWKQRGPTLLVHQSGLASQRPSLHATRGDQASFDTIIQLDPPGDGGGDAGHPGQKPADDIDGTQLATQVAAVIEQDAITNGDWSLMWLHTDCLKSIWDAPRFLFPVDAIEWDQPADLEPEAGTQAADGPTSSTASWPPVMMPGCEVPRIDLIGPSQSDPHHPDLLTSWMRTYGCQVRLLDLMIRLLSQSLVRKDVRVMLVGTSGFSLGQNGWMGHRAGTLRSPDLRLPLVIGNSAPLRVPHVTASDRLPDILRQLASDDRADGDADPGGPNMTWCSPHRWAASPQSDQDIVVTQSDRATRVVTTPQWFYVQDADQTEHLFLKPDDVEDYNDVAKLRPNVVETLRPLAVTDRAADCQS